jgi:tRNA(Ile2) C34 agmatinyltransferase TiaS
MESPVQLLVGIDDTDAIGHKPGTGRLARDLGAYLQKQGLAQLVGVVRHQLLVDPRVPYTSHNSPACLIVSAEPSAAQDIFDVAGGYIITRCHPASDPGLCVAEKDNVGSAVVQFGHLASSEVLSKIEATTVASGQDLILQELGGTGDGIIGALAAVGLTAAGNAGRFLEWHGALRDLTERVAAAELRRRGIEILCIARDGEVVPSAAMITTGDWVRPRLVLGRPVVLVEHVDGEWRCIDRKSRHVGGEA